jgi:hypothetical protein
VNGTQFDTPQRVTIALSEAGIITLAPGIYASIEISGTAEGSSVTFEPGIYILRGGAPHALSIVTPRPVTANGVLFYNTGSDYDAETGLPDTTDRNIPLVPGSGSATFGAMRIQASQWTQTPVNDSSSPFHGLAIYQRRGMRQPIILETTGTSGTAYARWGKTTLSGNGSCSLQIVGGQVAMDGTGGGAILHLSTPGPHVLSWQAYLVE